MGLHICTASQSAVGMNYGNHRRSESRVVRAVTMKPANAWLNGAPAFFCAAVLLLTAVAAAPVDMDDDLVENSLAARMRDGEVDAVVPLDAVDMAALRKLLMQLEAEERMGSMSRVARSWGGAADTRGWGPRGVDARIAPQWRTDKRQVRFRQCYFNPISCFGK